MRRLHFALAVLISLGSAPVYGVTLGSVSGSVRDSGGAPQIGAVVQLLRPDLSVVATIYTDDSGRFAFPAVMPGKYALKAMGTSFLPSLRENLRIRTHVVVNLTLNTLFEVMQWLPAEPRAANAQKDDWAWTLRSAANRPLLRWLEDGPLVVVTDRPGGTPRLKARLMATGQDGTFGENGERFTANVEDTPSNSRELLARVDFAPDTDQGMESMLGFRQDLGMAGSVQSVAAVAIHPEIDAGGPEGLDEAAIRTSETINMGDALQAEVGASQVLARFAERGPNTVTAALPFATVGWRGGNSELSYQMTTMMPGTDGADESQSATWLPEAAYRNSDLVLEHGVHQQLGWERRTDSSGVSVLVYADKVQNPVIEAADRASSAPAGVLFDPAAGLLHAAAGDYSTAGMTASVERRLPNGNFVRLSYANGDALVMSTTARPMAISQLIAGAHPRHAQMYSLALSGTLDGTHTHWRASYRWQPADTVTRVAPFAVDAAEPFLNLHLRQPLCVRGENEGHVEALLDVRNLLAEGYRPFVSSDGSMIVFAQDQRSIGAGLAFTF
jgi:Carboxypeptidase regulatory-like domain